MSVERPENRRYRAQPIPVGEAAEPVTRRAFGKRGFMATALVTNWPAIVGTAIASASYPDRISYPRDKRHDGTLHICVISAMAPVLQHHEPQILERVNGFYGYKAVTRIVLHHVRMPVKAARAEAGPPPPAEAPPADAAAALAAVEDPDLKAILERLGRHIAAKTQA